MKKRVLAILNCNLFRALLLLLFAWLNGCAPAVVGSFSPEARAVPVTDIAADGVFAVSPREGRIALWREALLVYHPETGEEVELKREKPSLLAWSPDGEKLAAVFIAEDRTTLRVFGAGGGQITQFQADGVAEALFWLSDDEPGAVLNRLKVFSFGGNYRSTLHRFPLRGQPVADVLADTTVKPLTLSRWPHLLPGATRARLGPLGDELLFCRLHDPPAFPPYVKIILRHLESGAETILADVPLGSSGGIFDSTGDLVFFDTGKGELLKFDPWRERELGSSAIAGGRLGISSDGGFMVAGPAVFQGDVVWGTLPEEAEAEFAPAGRGLYFRFGRVLYRLEGSEEGSGSSPSLAAELLALRRWRASGLISADEYDLFRERVDRK